MHARLAAGSRRTRWLALACGLIGAAGLAAAGQAQAASPECTLEPKSDNPDLYACTASTAANDFSVTFDEIRSAVAAAGADVTVADPAMWITAWGGQGGNGGFCTIIFRCAPDGGGGGRGGVAQTPTSPATFAAEYGGSTLHYWVGQAGSSGGSDATGGGGGAGTVVAAERPGRSSPAQAPPFESVVAVGGGGAGGGTGGSEHDGGGGGAGGKAVATFTDDADGEGADGGKTSDNGGSPGKGGNSGGGGGGGAGGASGTTYAGTEGVGGFGGIGNPNQAGASWVNRDLYAVPAPAFSAKNVFHSPPSTVSTTQSPGAAGNGVPMLGTLGGTSCDGCAGGGGGGYGGGGGASSEGDDDAAAGGGGAGSYAHSGTCDATGAPAVSNNREGDGTLVIYVDPSQDCSGAAPTDPEPAGPSRPAGPVSDTTLIRDVRTVAGAVTSGPDAIAQVRVRLAPRARIATAKLNGKGIKRQFRRSGSNTWVARLGGAEGARRGANQVIVRARRGRGQHYGTARFIRARTADLLDTRLVSGGPGARLRVQEKAQGQRETIVAIEGRRVPAGYIAREGDELSVRLTPAGGLGHGQNRVTAKVATPEGAVDTEAQTVGVPAAAPIADAGPRQRRGVHALVRLDGSRSLGPAGPAGQAPAASLQQAGPGALSYSWRITRQPPGADASLAGADTPTPSFRASAPGTYRVRLTVAANRRTSSDVTEVSVKPVPMAPIETLATGASGAPGIQLDSSWFCGTDGTDTSCLFHPNPAGVDSQVQLLVLDRATLEPLSNTSYDPSDLIELNKAISELVVDDGGQVEPDTRKLVIVTLGSGSVTDLTNFEAALKRIGAGVPGSDKTEVPGPLSIIGIPGMTVGKAWQSYGLTLDGGTPGSLAGFVKDSAYYLDSGVLENEQRVFTFGDIQSFETRKVEGDTITLTIAGQDVSFDTSAGGLGLVTFDPFSLALSGNTTFAPQGDGNGLDWASLAATLEGAVETGSGVALVSLGRMGDFAAEPQANAFPAVLTQLEKLGAQPDIFARAVNDNGTYSMLSSGGQGVESSSVVAAGVQTGATQLPVAAGNLTGGLQRTNDGRYIPAKADPSGIYEPALSPVLNSAPTDWLSVPSPDLGVQTALAWLAQCEFVEGGVEPSVSLWAGQQCSYSAADGPVTGTPDQGAVARIALELRADYYDNANLSLNNVAGLTYQGLFPAGNGVFTAADFEAAKTQLVAESNAVGATRIFFTNLGCSLSTCSGVESDQISNAMTQVSIAVQNAYFSGELAKVTSTTAYGWNVFGEWTVALSKFLQLLQPLDPSITQLFRFTALVGESAEAFAATQNGWGVSEWQDVDAWDILDNELRNVEANADQQVTDAISLGAEGVGISQDIVLSDWTRMSTVAANAQGPWRVSSDDLAEVANSFVIASRLQVWEAYASDLWTAGRIGINNNSIWPIGRNAASMYCRVSGSDVSFYSHAWQGGLPAGLGGGPQYWPVQSVASSKTRPSYDAYLAYDTASPLKVAPAEALAQIAAVPSNPGAQSTAAGAYGPWFWNGVFDLQNEITACENSAPTISNGGFYGVK